jgi:two-component system chemotaxis response regulator CheY
MRKVLKKALALTTLEIESLEEAKNGQDALEKIALKVPNLIFLDINMPIMTGIELMYALKEGGYTIPVIIISTEGSDDRKKELADLGIKAYLRKPISPEMLAECIAELSL